MKVARMGCDLAKLFVEQTMKAQQGAYLYPKLFIFVYIK